MTSEPLDFWNYPDWFGDSRDNLRDPNSEPFWMRPAAKPVKRSRTHKVRGLGEVTFGTEVQLIRHINGEVEVVEVLSYDR